MALTEATVTFDLHDYLGAAVDSRRTKVWLTTNSPDNTIHDSSTGETRLGGGTVTLNSDGTGSATVWTPGATANPLTWQTTIHCDYPDAATRSRKTVAWGPFTITASGELTDLVAEQIAIPTRTAAEYASDAEDAADTATAAASSASISASAAAISATEAEAARDDAVDISGISTSDGVVSALVAGTGGAGPLTRAALEPVVEAGVVEHGAKTGFVMDYPAETTGTGSSILPIGSIDGVAYGRHATSGQLYRSTDDGLTWTFLNAVGGYSIHALGDGEVILNGSGTLKKSSGWDVNPATATFTIVATANGTSAFIVSDVATYDNIVIAGEYAVPRTDARYLKVSTDYGATFTNVRDLNTMYPSDVTETHWHAVAIDHYHHTLYGNTNPRLWASHGDGPRGVIYSDDLGATWTNYDLNTWQPMPLMATPNGIVTMTDQNNPDGVWLIPRNLSAKQQIARIPGGYWLASLLGFGISAARDETTGIVYMLFRADQQTYFTDGRKAMIFATDGLRADLIYETVQAGTVGGSGSVSWSGLPAITDGGYLLSSYTDFGGTTRLVRGKVGRGTKTGRLLDGGNLLTGSTPHRTSQAVGYGSVSPARSVVIGTLAGKDLNVLTNTSIVLVGEETVGADQGTAVGFQADAGYAYGTALGYLAKTSNTEAVAVGAQATAWQNSTAVGRSATAGGSGKTNSVAIGRNAAASEAGCTAVGYSATASGASSTALGQAQATGQESVAAATSAAASNLRAVAVGYSATGSGQYGIAIGASSTAAGTDSIAIGRSAVGGSGQLSVALGQAASGASSWRGVALGYNATLTDHDQIQMHNRHFEISEHNGGEPAAPGADKIRGYALDDGSGNTQLRARFNGTSKIIKLGSSLGTSGLGPSLVPYTTAARPSAVTAGVGAQYYDTTLSKPGYSDGTVWRDAAGTAI